MKRWLIQNTSNITDVINGAKVYSYVPNSFKKIRECNYNVTYKLENADIILCELNPANYTRNKMFSRITIGFNIYKSIDVLKNSIGWCHKMSEFIPIVKEIEELMESSQLSNILVDVDVKHYFHYRAAIQEIFHDKEGVWIFDINEDIDIDKLFPIEYFRNIMNGIVVTDDVFESIKEQLNTTRGNERDLICNIVDTCDLVRSIRYVIRLVTEGHIGTYNLPIIKKKCRDIIPHSRDDFNGAIEMMKNTNTLTLDNLNWACNYYRKKKEHYTIEYKPTQELVDLATRTTESMRVLLNQVPEETQSCEFPHTQCDNDQQ